MPSVPNSFRVGVLPASATTGPAEERRAQSAHTPGNAATPLGDDEGAPGRSPIASAVLGTSLHSRRQRRVRADEDLVELGTVERLALEQGRGHAVQGLDVGRED